MKKNILKILGAGATIFGVGMAMVVLQPEPEAPVAEATADIYGLSFAPKTKQQKFVQSLMDEGFPEPRAYDHNGNRMFFSTFATPEHPRDVAERLQRRFVENGLNKHMHPRLPQFEIPKSRTKQEWANSKDEVKRLENNNKAMQAYLDDYIGGIVPMREGPNAVVMTGMTTDGGSEDVYAWAKEVFAANENRGSEDFSPHKTAQEMRYVDAFWEGHESRVTAVWSDDEYDVRKIVDKGGGDLNVDPNVPMCPGCSRLARFQGETEEDYDNHAIDGGYQSVDQVLNFYKSSFTARGWVMSDISKVIAGAEFEGMKAGKNQKMIQFANNESEFITVVAWSNEDGKTGVHVARSN